MAQAWAVNPPVKPNCVQVNTYIYTDEHMTRVDHVTLEVDYKSGAHRDKLEAVSCGLVEAHYFEKYRNFWYYVGVVRSATTTNGGMSFKLRVSQHVEHGSRKLCTSKHNSLKQLGFTKKRGSGTGTYSNGVCVIEKIDNTSLLNGLSIRELIDLRKQIDSILNGCTTAN